MDDTVSALPKTWVFANTIEPIADVPSGGTQAHLSDGGESSPPSTTAADHARSAFARLAIAPFSDQRLVNRVIRHVMSP